MSLKAEFSEVMRIKNPKQKYGRLVKSYGASIAELREGRKKKRQVLYLNCNLLELLPLGWKSANNAHEDILIRAIKLVGFELEENRIFQKDAEQLLDLLYAELHRRVENATKKA